MECVDDGGVRCGVVFEDEFPFAELQNLKPSLRRESESRIDRALRVAEIDSESVVFECKFSKRRYGFVIWERLGHGDDIVLECPEEFGVVFDFGIVLCIDALQNPSAEDRSDVAVVSRT